MTMQIIMLEAKDDHYSTRSIGCARCVLSYRRVGRVLCPHVAHRNSGSQRAWFNSGKHWIYTASGSNSIGSRRAVAAPAKKMGGPSLVAATEQISARHVG